MFLVYHAVWLSIPCTPLDGRYYHDLPFFQKHSRSFSPVYPTHLTSDMNHICYITTANKIKAQTMMINDSDALFLRVKRGATSSNRPILTFLFQINSAMSTAEAHLGLTRGPRDILSPLIALQARAESAPLPKREECGAARWPNPSRKFHSSPKPLNTILLKTHQMKAETGRRPETCSLSL